MNENRWFPEKWSFVLSLRLKIISWSDLSAEKSWKIDGKTAASAAKHTKIEIRHKIQQSTR